MYTLQYSFEGRYALGITLICSVLASLWNLSITQALAHKFRWVSSTMVRGRIKVCHHGLTKKHHCEW